MNGRKPLCIMYQSIPSIRYQLIPPGETPEHFTKFLPGAGFSLVGGDWGGIPPYEPYVPPHKNGVPPY